RDPELVRLVELMANQPDEPPKTPIRQGALTFSKFLTQLRSYQFRRKTREEQAHYRIETLKALEAPDAEVPLTDRLKLHEILLMLWQDNGLFARTCLLDIITKVPLNYGPWRALKRIYKEAEAKGDTEILGALAARFDSAYANGRFGINRITMAYM